jgi:hypothetical protein
MINKVFVSAKLTKRLDVRDEKQMSKIKGLFQPNAINKYLKK